MRWAGPALVAAVVLPRLFVLPVNLELSGDAIARTWLAHRWLEAPHVITHFDDGAKQFGPLHLYLLALAEWLWPSLEHAGRVLSLVAGALTAWPLRALTARRFGSRAATFAVLGFAFWGLHVQCSTIAASEALTLLLVMAAVERFDVGARWSSALLLSFACATRYDPWLLVPLLAVAEWRRTARPSAGMVFGAAASVFPALWLVGHQHGMGDAFFPLRYIDDFHRAWWPTEAAIWGEGTYRLACLLFWPGAAVLTLTPAFAVGGAVMLSRAWRERPELRWLVALIVVPAVLYTARAALFASFAPLARFTMKELLLLLPFAGWALDRWSQRWPWVAHTSIGLAAAWCLALGAWSFEPDTRWSLTARSIAPTLRLEQPTRGLVDTLAASTRERPGLLVVDEDPAGYDDLVISFYSGLPFDQQVRRRYDRYAETLANRSPRWLVLFSRGRLVREGAAREVEEGVVEFRGRRYVRLRAGRASVFELLDG